MKMYSNSYEKFLYEKTEEYRKNWRDSVSEVERLSKENADLKMTIERERQLHKLQLVFLLSGFFIFLKLY